MSVTVTELVGPEDDFSARDLVKRRKALAPSVINPKEPKQKVRPTPLAYVPSDRSEFAECTYDLGEIGRAIATEPMIDRSVDKHVHLCMKEGYRIVGRDPATVAYIKRRLFEFELGSGQPFDEFLKEATTNVVAFANEFIAYRRDFSLSSGRRVIKNGKALDPIAGIFNADPSSMSIRRNKWGEVKEYKQTVYNHGWWGESSKKFQPEDILHIAHTKQSGFAWGRPYVLPALEDVRLLRNIEELATMTIHKGTFPVIHWKIGSDSRPAIDFGDGSSEVTDVEASLRGRDAEGVFVTDERHEIKSIQIKHQDLSKYLEFFRTRVMTGLNLSTVDLGIGDTANRGTASTMTKALMHKCKDFQQTISCGITKLFDELLEEGGFEITSETRVQLIFPEIDIEAQQAVQNHAMALYQGHCITEDEMRVMIGREPLLDDARELTYFNTIELPRIEAQAEAKATLGPSATASENSTKTRNQPTNQSGRKASVGTKKNDLVEIRLKKFFNELADFLSDKDEVPPNFEKKALALFSINFDDVLSHRTLSKVFTVDTSSRDTAVLSLQKILAFCLDKI